MISFVRKSGIVLAVAVVLFCVVLYAVNTGNKKQEDIIQYQSHIGMSDITLPQISVLGGCKFSVSEPQIQNSETYTTADKSVTLPENNVLLTIHTESVMVTQSINGSTMGVGSPFYYKVVTVETGAAQSYQLINGDAYFILPAKSVGQMLGWLLYANVDGDCSTVKEPYSHPAYDTTPYDESLWEVSNQYPLPPIFKISPYVEPTQSSN